MKRGSKYIIAVGLATILIGLITIAGWFLGIERLTNIAAGLPTMKFNTALGFVLSGLSLLAISRNQHKIIFFTGLFSAITLTALASAELSEYIFHFNAGIDEFFIQDNFEKSAGLPGRMGAGTALSFLLCALGILGRLTHQKFFRRIAQYLFHTVSIIAIVAILGYMFQVPQFYKLMMLNSMALVTAVTFFIYSITATFIEPQLGVTGLFTGQYIGNRVARKLFPQMTIALFVLAFLRIEYNKLNPLSDDLGVALFGLGITAIWLFIIWRTSIWLNELDKKSAEAEEALYTANKNLEQTVTARTADLNASLEKLRQSEESFRLLVEGVSDYAIYRIDADGNIKTWNKGAEKIKGYTANEVLGRHISMFYSPEEIEKDEPWRNLEIARQRGHYEAEGERVRKDGSRFWASVLLTPLYENGELRGFSKVTRDITAKKNAEEISVREAALVQTIPYGIIYGTRHETRITSMNKAAEELLGISIAGARGKKLDEIVNIQVIGMSRKDVQNALWNGLGYWQGEAIFTTIDGRRLNILTTLKTVQDYKGEEIGWLGIYSDITALKVTEERLEIAFEGSSAGLWDWDLKKDKRWWSPKYYELLGYENNEIAANMQSLKAIVHPDDMDIVSNSIQRNLIKPGRFEVEVRYKTKNGVYKWFQVNAKTRTGINDEPLRMVGTLIDIDEKKKALQLISEQAELIKMLPDGIIYGNMKNRIISLNKGAELMFEVSSEEARGKQLEDIISFADPGIRHRVYKGLMEKGFMRNEIEFTNRSGKKLTVLTNVKLLADIEGKGPGWLCIYTDITPLRLNRELEGALDKLEANNQYLEQLAYISAHDIKAPIIALKGLAEVLVKGNAVSPDYVEVMNMFTDKIEHMQRTNNSLNSILKLRKNLLNKELANDQFLPLNSIVDDVLSSLKTETEQAGTSVKTYLNGIDTVAFPYVHLKSVFYNLISNAVKYRDPAKPLLITLQAKRLSGNTFEFTVTDNGLGIDLAQSRGKLFGIFKRFHNHVEGSGVGLHIVKSIAEAYNGNIQVDSEPGKGTGFKVIFNNIIPG